MKAPSLMLALVAVSLAWLGCGGRSELLAGTDMRDTAADGDGSIADGLDAGPDAASLALSNVCGDPAPKVPHCVPSSACESTYFPIETIAATMGWVGEYLFETVRVDCAYAPTTLQQWINGSWVSLEPWTATVGAFATVPYEFDVDSPAGEIALPSVGAPVGSVQQIRACVTTYVVTGGPCNAPVTVVPLTACDPPSPVTIPPCSDCPPVRCGEGSMAVDNCVCVSL